MWVSRITGTWREMDQVKLYEQENKGIRSWTNVTNFRISAFFSLFTPSSKAVVHTRGIKSDILCFILNPPEEHI